MIKKLKLAVEKICKNVLPEDIYLLLLTKYLQWSQRKNSDSYMLPFFVRWKINPKEKVCIFRFHRPGFGLFAVARAYAFAADWAYGKGYIPIVDWEYLATYQENGIGEDNAWDYVFDQQMLVKEALKKDWVLIWEIGIENAYRSQTCFEINKNMNDHKLHIVTQDWRIYYKKVNELISNSWIFLPQIVDAVDDYIEKYFANNIYIGVSLQEDFSKDADALRKNEGAKELYSKHPQADGILTIIEKVKMLMEKWDCKNLFVATVYQDSVDIFKEEFGENVCFWDRKRRNLKSGTENIEKLFDMSLEGMRKYYQESETSYKEECIPYAQEVLVLSKCQYLIAMPCSGTIGALSLNGGKYKDIDILEDYNKATNY